MSDAQALCCYYGEDGHPCCGTVDVAYYDIGWPKTCPECKRIFTVCYNDDIEEHQYWYAEPYSDE